jgi:hypothetical protein
MNKAESLGAPRSGPPPEEVRSDSRSPCHPGLAHRSRGLRRFRLGYCITLVPFSQSAFRLFAPVFFRPPRPRPTLAPSVGRRVLSRNSGKCFLHPRKVLTRENLLRILYVRGYELGESKGLSAGDSDRALRQPVPSTYLTCFVAGILAPFVKLWPKAGHDRVWSRVDSPGGTPPKELS